MNAQGFEISRKVFQYPNIYVDDAHKKFAIGDRDKIYDYNHLLDFSGHAENLFRGTLQTDESFLPCWSASVGVVLSEIIHNVLHVTDTDF